jgi:arylsulfatase A-like enzyme
MVTADSARTPTFTLFGDENYFIFSSGSTTNCNAGTACVIEQPGFAWNHGDFQEDITKTWLGLVGPGVRKQGIESDLFSDHSDVRPTIMALAGIEDDYDHDGRALFEVFDGEAGSRTLREHREILLRLAQAYKQINAPRGELNKQTLKTSTVALSGDNETYEDLDEQLAMLLKRRDALALKMIGMIEDATFDRQTLDEQQAKALIDQADALLDDAGAH